jgi:hypothetical protein
MAESLESQQQKKVLRTLTRLKHSLAADREIYTLLKQREEIGSSGVVPQLETTLAEVLGATEVE